MLHKFKHLTIDKQSNNTENVMICQQCFTKENICLFGLAALQNTFNYLQSE